MTRKIIFLHFLFITLCYTTLNAQMKIGAATAPVAASILELESTNQGFVLPRISLISINSNAPLGNTILTSTIVYNTNAIMTGGSGTGIYYWDGSKWNFVSNSTSGYWSLTGNSGTNPATNFIGTTDAQPLIFKVNGQRAGYLNSSGSATSTSFGYQSLNSSTGNDNTAIGYFALSGNTTGFGNTSTGVSSLHANTTGTANTTNGWNSLYNNTAGNNNTAIGKASLFNNVVGNDNTANGVSSLLSNNSDNNTAIGYSSLINNTSGNSNTAVGVGSLQTNITGTNNTAIGNTADVTNSNLTNATAIGYKASVNISNALVLGDSTDNVNVGIGTGSPTASLHVKGTIRFAGLTNGILAADANGNLSTTTLSAINSSNWSLTGNSGTNPSANFIGTTDVQPLIFKINGIQSGKLDYALSNTSFGFQTLNTTVTGGLNTAIGHQSMSKVTTGNRNTAVGYGSLFYNTTGMQNSAIGLEALFNNTTGSYNTASGQNALLNNSTGNYNTASGIFALQNNTTGNNNTASGVLALIDNTTGNDNSATGVNALNHNTTGTGNVANGNNALGANTTGSNNTGVGPQALGSNTIGSFNTALGSGADVTTGNLTNATAIGYKASVNVSNALVLGDSTDNVTVGIGTGSPTANLHVKGTVRFAGLTNGILTADANGNLSSVVSSSLVTANNGLTQSGNNIALGGTLTQATAINQGGNSLIIQGSGTSLMAGQISNTYSPIAFGFLTPGISDGQSFTLSSTAMVTSITIYNDLSNASGNVTLNLFNGNGTIPTYSQVVAASFGLTTYILTIPQTLSAGVSRFEFVQGAGNSMIDLDETNSNTYAGGSPYRNGAAVQVTIFDVYFIINYTSLQPSPTIYADQNGNVGIGTSSPQRKLQVYNNGYGITQTNGTVEVGTYVDNNYGWLGTASNHPLAFFTNNGSASMLLTTNGNFGIGTSSPGANAKVEIVGGTSANIANYEYVNAFTYGHTNAGTGTYSLYTSNRIWCGEELDVTSDMRTKTNIITSGSLKDLGLINKLRVVNYNYKDKVAKGTSNITGFLAQEVEQVMPDAVTKNKGVVPDIYQNATSLNYDSAAKTLRLGLQETVDIKAGDTLKLITNAGEQLAPVALVKGKNITVGNWLQNSKWVFVYGKQVNDLRNLDYNKIFSAGIGAIQELSKQNDELQKDNTSMKQDIETLKAQVKMFMDKMSTIAKDN